MHHTQKGKVLKVLAGARAIPALQWGDRISGSGLQYKSEKPCEHGASLNGHGLDTLDCGFCREVRAAGVVEGHTEVRWDCTEVALE